MNFTIKYLISLALIFNFLLLFLYRFPKDPSLGYTPTKKFEDAPIPHWKSSVQWESTLKKQSLSIVFNSIENDDDYCEKVSIYRKKHPIKLDHRKMPKKKHRVFYANYGYYQLPTVLLRKYGKTVLEDYIGEIEGRPTTTLDPSITSFYTLTPSWHKYHEIGKHFLCEGQRYNHIPGNYWLSFKDVAVDNMREYAEHYRGRTECFDPWEILPFTYNLKHSDQCWEFLKIIESQVNSNEIQWILKKSRFSHRGKGVFVLDSSLASSLLEEFECPSDDKFIAQAYIKNPMLIDGKKFDFRVYLLIASMDPLIILYGNGFIRISLELYDAESNDKTVHLTNTDIANEKLDKMTAEEKEDVLNDQSWSLQQLEEYLVGKRIAELGWLEGEVKPFLKKMMLHLVRMSLDKLLRHPGVYELFGIDFLLDDNLHLWFLETNLTPAMVEGNQMKNNLYDKLMKDVLDVEFALQYGADLDEIMNGTNLEWIFDGRKKGYERYHNVLSPDCL